MHWSYHNLALNHWDVASIWATYPFNSLAPERCGSNLKSIIFKLIMQNSLGTCCEIALGWTQQYLTNEKSTLVQVIVWYLQATSHYHSQIYVAMWPQWVNLKGPQLNFRDFLVVEIKAQQGGRTNFPCNQTPDITWLAGSGPHLPDLDFHGDLSY